MASGETGPRLQIYRYHDGPLRAEPTRPQPEETPQRLCFLIRVVFERLADEDFAYVTTTGRRTGKAHTIEIWFALDDGRMYLLSGGGHRSDWVKNIRKNGSVRVRVGSRAVAGRARLVAPDSAEDSRARRMLDAKYMDWREGRRLSSWARTAVPVAIDLPAAGGGRPRTPRELKG